MSADIIDLTYILAARDHFGVANDDSPYPGEITIIERYFAKRIDAVTALFEAANAMGAQA